MKNTGLKRLLLLIPVFLAVAVAVRIDLSLKSVSAVEPQDILAENADEIAVVLQKPVEGNVTSPFGKRINPISGKEEIHVGIDIAAAEGTPIALALDGVVSEVGENRYDGNFVLVDHGDGLFTKYCHCREVFVKNGYCLRRGETVGAVGSTGWATGAHLHFEILKNGKYFDPAWLLTW